MDKCMACGKTALLGKSFGNTILCRNCASILDLSNWIKRDFASINELKTAKLDIIQKATSNNMPEYIVQSVSNYFDEYIDAGYVTTIDGRAGQILKVFSEFCVISTANESVCDELVNNFDEFDGYERENDDSLFSSNDKMNIVSGLMSGRLVRTGIGVAVSASLNKQRKEKEAERLAKEHQEKVEVLFNAGDRRIILYNISSVELYSRSNITNGYLQFIPRNITSPGIYDCEYFVYNNSLVFHAKKMRENINSIRSFLNDRIAYLHNQKQENEKSLEEENIRKIVEQTVQQSKTDSFEEIRKYKALLDEGIITEEDFISKKKELLGL